MWAQYWINIFIPLILLNTMKIKSAEFIRGIKGTDKILTDAIPQVAFVGRSNVGKSSVINSLLNRNDLARVGKKPGKTREINFFLINKKFYLVDLPGYGYAKVSPEKKEKIKKLILWYLMFSEARPSTVVLVLDIKAGFTEFDREMANVIHEQGHPFVIVANKIDKLNRKDLLQQLNSIKKESGVEDIVPYSAAKKDGVDELLKKIFS